MTRSSVVLLAVVLSSGLWSSTEAQQAVVVRDANLRSTASTAHDPIRLLVPPDTVTLISAKKTAGYLHVRTKAGEAGWAWAANVTILAGATATDSSHAASSGNAGGPTLPVPGSYFSDNPACPVVGTHPVSGTQTPLGATTDAGLRNMAKRHVPVGSSPVTLTLATFKSLQADVNSRFTDAHEKETKFQPDRTALMHRPTSAGTIGEGDLVQIAAYLTAIAPQGNESVNCAGKDGDDIHINIGTRNSTEWAGVVVEMIPQLGHIDGWDAATLRKVAAANLEVLVVGGLTYDNEHLVNDDSSQAKTNQPKRVSLWEIHPITAFFVCASGTCDPENHGAWITLTAWSTGH